MFTPETLLYAGLACMAAAVIASIVAVIAYSARKKALNRTLEKEYGPKNADMKV